MRKGVVIFLLAGLILLAGVGEQKKLVVYGVVPQSPAQVAGLQIGDIFFKYNGKEARTLKGLFELKNEVKVGSVDVVIIRDKEEITVKLPAGQMGVYLKEVLPDIKYKKDAVVIEGISKLAWETGKYCTFHACLEAIANHLGIKKDYLYLSGISGSAFRLHFHKNWCPSSPDPGCGYNTADQALSALGLNHHFRYVPVEDTAGQRELRKEIIASIDKGIPVIAVDLIEVPEWGIITGYQDGGKELICRTYFDRRVHYDIADKSPWAVFFIDGKGEMPSDRDNFMRAFNIAHENLTTEEYDMYYSGINAFSKWIQKLQTDDFAAMEDKDYKTASHANAWIYDRLIEDRTRAAEFLNQISDMCPRVSTKLKALSKIYSEEIEILKPSEKIVMYEFNMKKRSDWSPEMRKKAVARLTKAKGKEAEALKIWKEVLEITGAPEK